MSKDGIGCPFFIPINTGWDKKTDICKHHNQPDHEKNCTCLYRTIPGDKHLPVYKAPCG